MSKNQDSVCLVCHSGALTPILELKAFPLYFGALPKKDVASRDEYPLTIVKCENCMHVQQVSAVDENIMNKVYEADYYNCPCPTGTNMGVSEIEKFYKFFLQVNSKPRKLLEIGCFDGYLLHKLKSNVCDVYGIDPSTVTQKARRDFPAGRIVNAFYDEESFQDTKFDGCKFMGVDFRRIDTFILTFKFEKCLIDGCNFSDLILQGVDFLESDVKNCFYSKTDLTGCTFSGSDLSKTEFHDCDLTEVDFRQAINYSINPDTNKFKKTKFSSPEVISLLHYKDIIID